MAMNSFELLFQNVVLIATAIEGSKYSSKNGAQPRIVTKLSPTEK